MNCQLGCKRVQLQRHVQQSSAGFVGSVPCQSSCKKYCCCDCMLQEHELDSGAAVQGGATVWDRCLASQKTFGWPLGQVTVRESLTSLPPWPQHLLHALTQAAVPGQHYGVAYDEHLSALQIVRRDVGCRPVTDMAATFKLRSGTRELAPWSPVDMLCSLLPLSMDIASGLQEQQIRSHPSAAAGNGRRWCCFWTWRVTCRREGRSCSALSAC